MKTKHYKNKLKGFLSYPTPKQIAPTEREISMLKMLDAWQEASKHSNIILGVPSK